MPRDQSKSAANAAKPNRNRLVKSAFLLLVFCGLALTAAADPRVTLDIQPRVLRLNEAATLKLSFINMEPSQIPPLPEIDGFSIQYMGQESHTSIINSRAERRLTFNFRVFPSTPGKFNIGPFSMNVNGRPYQFDAMAIEVLPPSGDRDGRSGSAPPDELIFARIQLPRAEVFLQERFDVEVHLYYRGINLDRGIQLMNLPGTGLNLEDLQETGASREVVDNEVYEVRHFRLRGTALTAGVFELNPVARVNVLVRRERGGDPFFRLLHGGMESQPLNVPVKSAQITIRPLPTEGRPPGFGGAVGFFDMQLDVQPREVTAGEPVTLTIRISGRGNFENISMPSIDLGETFRRYDPRLVAQGRDHKVFEQVFIPRDVITGELPSVNFSFFDPDLRQYQTITRGPLPLIIRPGAATTQQLVQAPTAPPTPADRTPLGLDIIDLKRGIDLAPTRTESPTGTSINPAARLAPLFALAALAMLRRRHHAARADTARRRRTLAPRSARAAIRAAEDALQANDATRFHQALWQAFADYLGHRRNLDPGEISPAIILAFGDHLTTEQQAALSALLHACDEARFAGGGGSLDAQTGRDRLRQTQDIMRAMERIKGQ